MALTALTACGAPDPPMDPAAAAAVELFSIAQGLDPSPDELAARFDEPPQNEGRRATLLDALATLAALPAPRVVAVELQTDPNDAFVDLESELAGGGLARFTVRLAADGAGGWRVRWFQGPGVTWPANGGVRNQGLTSSAAPAGRR